MRDLNKVIIKGNLVHDPEIKYIPGGTAFLSVAVAVNDQKKQGDVYVDAVHYIDVVMFGKLAENTAKYKRKGDPVLVFGKLAQSRWENSDGQKRSKVGVVAEELTFLHRASNSEPRTPNSELPQTVGEVFPGAEPVGDGEIPF